MQEGSLHLPSDREVYCDFLAQQELAATPAIAIYTEFGAIEGEAGFKAGEGLVAFIVQLIQPEISHRHGKVFGHPANGDIARDL